MYVASSSTVAMYDCSIVDNWSGENTGGIYITGTSTVVNVNCLYSGNSATSYDDVTVTSGSELVVYSACGLNDYAPYDGVALLDCDGCSAESIPADLSTRDACAPCGVGEYACCGAVGSCLSTIPSNCEQDICPIPSPAPTQTALPSPMPTPEPTPEPTLVSSFFLLAGALLRIFYFTCVKFT